MSLLSAPLPLLLFFSVLPLPFLAQFNPQTYPDPRLDPLSCRLLLPAQVCDPSEVLTADERRLLNEKIVRLQQITANIKNSATACADTTKNTNLYIMVALIDRFSTTLPFDSSSSENSASIEKFTNQLRSKYQNYQDNSMCDPLVLIVNSRAHRQVFTVAGRDAKLSREVLQTAFQRNVGHFRSGNFGLGLEGMAEYIVSAYSNAHIVRMSIPSPGEQQSFGNAFSTSLPGPSNSGTGQFVAHGVRQQQQKPAPLDPESLPEGDRLWVRILAKAAAQCGDDADRLVKHARAVVEEAMDISLKLLSDPRHNKIEEDAQNAEKGPNARDKAWQGMQPFLEGLYAKYGSQLQRLSWTDQCPMKREGEMPKQKAIRIARLN